MPHHRAQKEPGFLLWHHAQEVFCLSPAIHLQTVAYEQPRVVMIQEKMEKKGGKCSAEEQKSHLSNEAGKIFERR